MPEERRSYIIIRPDGLVIHTRPVMEDEARWLHYYAYYVVKDAALKARYLSEWGNVMDANEYLERLRQLGADPYYIILGVYDDPERLTGLLAQPLNDPQLPPEARQAVKEFLGKIREFLREPVRPKPIESPVRYLELSHRHVTFDSSSGTEEVVPQPEWHAHEDLCCGTYFGISVFMDSFWLWFQSPPYAWAVAVRRDVSDGDVITALANDNVAAEFLERFNDIFRGVINRREADLIDRGYDDVVRKAKIVLTTLDLLNAGRREEGVPA